MKATSLYLREFQFIFLEIPGFSAKKESEYVISRCVVSTISGHFITL